MAWPYQPEDVWRDFDIAFNKISGAHNPSKAEIRTLIRAVLTAIDTLSAAAGFDPSTINALRDRVVGFEKGRLNPASFTFDRSIIRDLQGAINNVGTPRVFLPRTYDITMPDAQGVPRRYTQTVTNAESSELPGYVLVGLAGTPTIVVLDPDQNRYVVVASGADVSQAGTRFVTVGAYWNGAWYSQHRTLVGEQGALSFAGTNYVDRQTLFIQQFFYFGEGGVVYNLTPPNGAMYFELPLSVDTFSGSVVSCSFDTASYLRGDAFTSFLALASGSSRAVLAPATSVPILRVFKGGVQSAYPVAKVVPNITNVGKSSNLAPILFGDTVQTNVVDATLNGLGFTNGYSSPTGAPFHGFYLPRRRSRGFAFVRLWLFSSADNAWGSPQVFGVPSAGANTYYGSLAFEKSLSTRIAIYSGIVPLFQGRELNGLIAGTFAPTGVTVLTMGLQVGLGETPDIFVSRDDYPGALVMPSEMAGRILSGPTLATILSPRVLFLVKGRRQTFTPMRLLPRTAEANRYEPSLELTGSDGTPILDAVGSSHCSVTANASYTSARFKVRDKTADPGNDLIGTATVVTVPERFPAGTTRKVLMIGDSLTNRLQPKLLGLKAAQIGIGITFIGTVKSAGTLSGANFQLDTTGPLAEAREGKRASDYVNATTTLAPVPVGQESTYLANDKNTQINKNPFVRVATGSDPVGNVKNGYIFDFGFYLSRFSLATPDEVTIALSTNDFLQAPDAATAIANVTEALRIMVTSIRAAGANIRIGIIGYGHVRSLYGDAYWDNFGGDLARAILVYERNLADAKVFSLPGWLVVSPEVGWGAPAAGATATDTGAYLTQPVDNIHWSLPNVEKLSEMTLAFVAAGLTTGFDAITTGPNGNVGIGTTVPSQKLHVAGTGDTFVLIDTPAGSSAQFATARAGAFTFIGLSSAGQVGVASAENVPITLAANNYTERARFDAVAWKPGQDNTYSAGTAALRFTQFFAATATVGTSDGRLKLTRTGEAIPADWRLGSLTPNEIAAAQALAREIGAYLWRDSYAEKGDRARLHIGLIAQRVAAIMEEHGLDPFAYGMVCHDTWDATPDTPAVCMPVRDKNGHPTGTLKVVVPAKPGSPAGESYGLRDAEVHAFILAGQEARLAALEAARSA